MTEGELPTFVRAIITDEEGRVLLLRRAEGLKKYSGLWELPGGWVRPGESLPACLERTVFEETGLTLDVCGCSGSCESAWEGKTEVHQIWVAHPQRKEIRLAPGHTSSTWAGRDEIEMFRAVPWLTDAVRQVF
ncbi:NUDIX hydrolase [Methanofollis sp. UBA420]|jgi:8-oxo-dGTP diphosphatase|uniref:NUDIX hydrolase n=1 Tax=Methanofollis sp. UBA420 TaxID=1915514 RepID=UPI00316AC91F